MEKKGLLPALEAPASRTSDARRRRRTQVADHLYGRPVAARGSLTIRNRLVQTRQGAGRAHCRALPAPAGRFQVPGARFRDGDGYPSSAPGTRNLEPGTPSRRLRRRSAGEVPIPLWSGGLAQGCRGALGGAWVAPADVAGGLHGVAERQHAPKSLKHK